MNAERNRTQSAETETPITLNGDGRIVREPQWPRVAARTGEQLFFLRRLRRLTALNRYCSEELPSEDPEMRLLRHAIYSTYRDCAALGMTDEAQEILAQFRSSTTAHSSDARRP